MPFENFDFTDFWYDSDSDYVKALTYPPPTDEEISNAEKRLGYKLPESYIALTKLKNGGIPNKTCHPTNEPTSWSEDHVAITSIHGIHNIAEETEHAVDNWGYPAIGVVICDCPSAGHDMLFLDYRDCGPQMEKGEPSVVHIDQECDYEITFVADNFEGFILGLVSDEEYDDEDDV